jgi:hypothetical protein
VQMRRRKNVSSLDSSNSRRAKVDSRLSSADVHALHVRPKPGLGGVTVMVHGASVASILEVQAASACDTAASCGPDRGAHCSLLIVTNCACRSGYS